jgi:outer membrane protein OmpA-like peptidoglycan-associated protein
MNNALLVALLAAAPAFADAVDVSVQNRMLVGEGVPTLNVHINEPIAGFQVKLKRSDGKALDVKGGGPPGVTRSIDLVQPEGSFGYKGEILVNSPRGEQSSMPLEFTAQLFPPLRIKLEKKDVDLSSRKLAFTLNRPASKADVKITMDSGAVAFDGEVPFNGEAPGTPLQVTWPESTGKVMKIAVKGYDTESPPFFNGVELFPWQIDIPHEEVNFDTGKWDVRPGEKKKLEDSYQKIQDAVLKYGTLAKIKLYIAGHTDSVGPNDSNRTLSLNRARSIGGYLRQRGLSLPVFYEGFGEEALLVNTPDNTDEERNRRAEYIISVDAPTMKSSSVGANWRKL